MNYARGIEVSTYSHNGARIPVSYSKCYMHLRRMSTKGHFTDNITDVAEPQTSALRTVNLIAK